jgi:hypothetical protein
MNKMLKKIGLWAGLFLLGLILISFLLPSEVHVKRSIEIKASMEHVFDQVVDLRNWEKWDPWKRMDPTMVITFSNPPLGEGSFYKWESQNKQLGSGTLTLKRVVQFEEIQTAIEFDKRGTGSTLFQFHHKGDNVVVDWSMDVEVGMMPWSKYMGLMMRSELKKQFDKGLEGLKFYAEKN